VAFGTLEGSCCANVVTAPLEEVSERIGAFGRPALVIPSVCRLGPFQIATPFQFRAQIYSPAGIANLTRLTGRQYWWDAHSWQMLSTVANVPALDVPPMQNNVFW
jgi:hypothetical protein